MTLLTIFGAVALTILCAKFLNDAITKKIKESVDNEIEFYEYKFDEKIKSMDNMIAPQAQMKMKENEVFPKTMPDEWKKEFKEFVKRKKQDKKKIRIISKKDDEFEL